MICCCRQAFLGGMDMTHNQIACVGKTTPDFTANAFVDGAFRKVQLSSYRGQWVVLCFYPGNFTFV